MPLTVRLNESVGHSDIEGTTETYLVADAGWPSHSTSRCCSAPRGSHGEPSGVALGERLPAPLRHGAEGRLDTLVDELLELEKGGATPEVVASLFREAHTIKGGAAVVGMPHVARVAHALEDLLEEVRRERRGVDTALIDAVLAGVDASAP